MIDQCLNERFYKTDITHIILTWINDYEKYINTYKIILCVFVRRDHEWGKYNIFPGP